MHGPITIGKKEIIAFVERHARRKIRQIHELHDGEAMCLLCNAVFPRCRIKPASRTTNSSSQCARRNWGRILKAIRKLRIPQHLLDTSAFETGDIERCLSVLVLFFFLYNLARATDFSAEFAFDVREGTTEFLQSADSVRALVIGGALPLSSVPEPLQSELRSEFNDGGDDVLWRSESSCDEISAVDSTYESDEVPSAVDVVDENSGYRDGPLQADDGVPSVPRKREGLSAPATEEIPHRDLAFENNELRMELAEMAARYKKMQELDETSHLAIEALKRANERLTVDLQTDRKPEEEPLAFVPSAPRNEPAAASEPSPTPLYEITEPKSAVPVAASRRSESLTRVLFPGAEVASRLTSVSPEPLPVDPRTLPRREQRASSSMESSSSCAPLQRLCDYQLATKEMKELILLLTNSPQQEDAKAIRTALLQKLSMLHSCCRTMDEITAARSPSISGPHKHQNGGHPNPEAIISKLQRDLMQTKLKLEHTVASANAVRSALQGRLSAQEQQLENALETLRREKDRSVNELKAIAVEEQERASRENARVRRQDSHIQTLEAREALWRSLCGTLSNINDTTLSVASALDDFAAQKLLKQRAALEREASAVASRIAESLRQQGTSPRAPSADDPDASFASNVSAAWQQLVEGLIRERDEAIEKAEDSATIISSLQEEVESLRPIVDVERGMRKRYESELVAVASAAWRSSRHDDDVIVQQALMHGASAVAAA